MNSDVKNASQDPKVKMAEKEMVKKIISLKQLTPKERIEFLKQLNPRGVAPKPPAIKYTEGCNLSKLPDKLKAIILRAKEDPEYLESIVKELNRAIQVVTSKAQEQTSWCDKFFYPRDLGEKLLKIFGVSKAELLHEMQKIGFDSRNRNYTEPYYVTLTIVYTIGVLLDDKSIRIPVILLVAIRYWNALNKTIFKFYCDPEIMAYVQQYMTRKNAKIVLFPTPYVYLITEFVHQKDKLLVWYIRQDAADPKNGMIKLLTSIQPQLQNVIVKTVGKHYYEAHEKGLKISSNETHSSSYKDGGDMIESKETIQNIIEQLFDKFEKNQAFDAKGLMNPDSIAKLKSKFSVKESMIKQVNDWIHDNEEDVRMIAEYILYGVKPKSEEEFCQLNPDVLSKQIGNAKKTEEFLKIKKYREQITEAIFGKEVKEKLNAQSWYRLLNFVNYALILYVKKLICGR